MLEQHPKVARVYYPVLRPSRNSLSPKNNNRFRRNAGFELKGGADAGIQLMNTVSLCLLARTWAVETLITHPSP